MDDSDTLAPRRYVLTWAAAALGIVALVGLHGVLVDPFGLFGTRLIPQHDYARHGRMRVNGDRVVKALTLERSSFDTLLLGSSRVQYGLDPTAPALRGARVYNAALGALEAGELAAELRFAVDHQPGLKRLIVGLDIFSFTDPRDAGQGDYALSGFANHSAVDGYASRLFSVDAIEGSTRFWRAVARHEPGDMAMDGRQQFSPELDGDRGAIFRERAGEATAACGDPKLLDRRMADRLARLLRPLEDAKLRGVTIDLFLTPLHVWNHALDEIAGLTPIDETFKRLVGALATTLDAAPGPGRVTLTDFDILSDAQLEPVPAVRSGAETVNYWEPAHFRPQPLGDRLLAALSGPPDPAFGVRFDPRTFDDTLAATAGRLTQWMAAHPDDVATLRPRADAKRACEGTP